MMTRSMVGIGIVAAVCATSSVALADNVCGTTPATWNVPIGNVALTQTEGPIKAVIASIGEYRSHSMISTPNGYVTHATSLTPQKNGSTSPYWWPGSSYGSECWNPLDVSFLHNSTPGLEQVQAGAIYEFLYANGTNTFLSYQRAANPSLPATSNWGNAIGNYTWNGGDGLGFNWLTSGTDSSQHYYGITYNGAPVHYGWYQYMNLQASAQGVPGVDTGVICSTSAAAWQHDALVGTAGYTGDVIPRTYNSSTITNGANALYNAVYSECESQNGWFSSFLSFATNLGWNALCVGSGEGSICSAAADQMVNCFASNHCGDQNNYHNYNQGEWHGIAANSNGTTISPDAIGCWSGNGTGGGCTGAGSSVWGWDVSQTVQWNSGGNQYSCWD